MPITKSQTPNEFLVRWSDAGQIQGAHIVFREAVVEDGVELTSRLLPAQPVALAGSTGFPLADVLGDVQASALATIEARDGEIAALQTARQAVEAERDAAQARAAELQAQLDAIHPPAVNGVPQVVSKRQAKTLMELTAHPAGNLWIAANAAAEAIADPAQRIITVNYLRDSQVYEYARVLPMAQALMGMTAAQVDAMFIAADKL